MTSWQKAIKYGAIVFAAFLTVSIIGGILSAFAGFSFILGDRKVSGEQKSYSLSQDIESLEINISAADLTLKSGDTFSLESNNKYLSVEEKNGKLIITEKKRVWSSYSGDVQIILTVPKRFIFKNADITAGAGRFAAEALSSENLSLKLGAGEVQIESLNATAKAEIDGGAGKVTVSGGELNNLDLDMGVGEFSLTSKLTGKSELDLGVGAADITLIGSKEDYRISLDKGLGEALIDGEKMVDGTVYGSGESKINIDGGIGKMTVKFEEA